MLSEAYAHMSTAVANLSLLSKITDPVTFKTILHVSVCPIVQLSIPERFLDPFWESDIDRSQLSMFKHIKQDLLLMSDKAVLAKEPVNRPTHLLCAVVWLKLSHTFLNKGTQKEAAVRFQVQEKQLSRLITGRKYWGGTDKAGVVEKCTGMEKGPK